MRDRSKYIATGTEWTFEQIERLDDAIARATRAAAEKRPLAIGLHGNAAELLSQIR